MTGMMRAVCAWCEPERQLSLLGERPPRVDHALAPAVPHSIGPVAFCSPSRRQRWSSRSLTPTSERWRLRALGDEALGVDPGVDRVGRGEDLVPPGSDKGSPAVVHRLRRQEPDTGVRCSVLYHAVAPGAA